MAEKRRVEGVCAPLNVEHLVVGLLFRGFPRCVGDGEWNSRGGERQDVGRSQKCFRQCFRP